MNNSVDVKSDFFFKLTKTTNYIMTTYLMWKFFDGLYAISYVHGLYKVIWIKQDYGYSFQKLINDWKLLE